MKTNCLAKGEAYLKALNDKNLEAIGTYVHPDLKFKTPIMEFSSRHDFLVATRQLVSRVKGVKVKSKFATETQAMFTYDLIFEQPIGPTRTASLMTFDHDKITEIELFYDARPFEKPAASQPAK